MEIFTLSSYKDENPRGDNINILINTGHLFQGDLELFFGPLDEGEDIFVIVPEDTTWAHVMAGLGCFPSVSQARKNGWNKEVEKGFTPTFKVGKANRKFITALRPTDDDGAIGERISHER